MTDQTQFERELTDRLRERADRTRIDLDHDRITGASRAQRAPRARRAPARPTWAVAGAFAAVIALVVTGLVLLVRTDEDRPAPADTVVPTTPSASTVPATPYYGVLDDTDGPTMDDHWHVAYGFHLCGQWFQLTGNLEDPASPGYDTFMQTGIHSHDDGVIHVHPYTEAGTGDGARLGVFLAGYGVILADDQLAIPADQPLAAALPCDVSERQVSVVVWPDALDPADPIVLTSGLSDVPLRDGAAITITDDLDAVTPPPWASALPDLAAIDVGQTAPDDLLQPVPTSGAEGTIAPVGPITDFAACGRAVRGPAADLGIETERIEVAPDGSSFDLTLRNTTADPVTVGVAPFLTTLGPDGTVSSRPSVVGVWQYQVVPPGESLTVPVEEAVAGAGILGVVGCDATAPPEPTEGAREFVAVLEIGGEVVTADPVGLALSDGGVVVASSVPAP